MENPASSCQLIENDAAVSDRGAPSREEPWSWYLRRRGRGLYRRIRSTFAPTSTLVPAAYPRLPTSDLQAGDAVRVRSREEIASTLDPAGKFHGCAFMPNMYAFCRREFRVLKRVECFFDERRGRMLRCHNVVLLEGAYCDASFEADFRGCDRTCFLFWRTEWLDLVP